MAALMESACDVFSEQARCLRAGHRALDDPAGEAARGGDHMLSRNNAAADVD